MQLAQAHLPRTLRLLHSVWLAACEVVMGVEVLLVLWQLVDEGPCQPAYINGLPSRRPHVGSRGEVACG